MAAEAYSRQNVFLIAIPYHQHMLRFQAKRLHAERKDARIGLADTHNGALNYLVKIDVYTKIFEYSLHIAIKI